MIVGRRPADRWELRPRAAPTARSLAAAAILAVAGAGVGGPVGWAACAFFAAACVALAVQLVERDRLAGFGPDGVTLAAPRGSRCTIPWTDVAAIVLWTQVSPDGRPVDVLGVVTQPAPATPPPPGVDGAGLAPPASLPPPGRPADLPAAPLSPGKASPPVGSDADRVVAAATPLIDCRLDCHALKAALVGFSDGAALVDRRA